MHLHVFTKDLDNRRGVEPVTDWFHYQVLRNELVTVSLDNGRVLTVTKTHEFVMMDGSRKLAGQLRSGDDLME